MRRGLRSSRWLGTAIGVRRLHAWTKLCRDPRNNLLDTQGDLLAQKGKMECANKSLYPGAHSAALISTDGVIHFGQCSVAL